METTPIQIGQIQNLPALTYPPTAIEDEKSSLSNSPADSEAQHGTPRQESSESEASTITPDKKENACLLVKENISLSNSVFPSNTSISNAMPADSCEPPESATFDGSRISESLGCDNFQPPKGSNFDSCKNSDSTLTDSTHNFSTFTKNKSSASVFTDRMNSQDDTISEKDTTQSLKSNIPIKGNDIIHSATPVLQAQYHIRCLTPSSPSLPCTTPPLSNPGAENPVFINTRVRIRPLQGQELNCQEALSYLSKKSIIIPQRRNGEVRPTKFEVDQVYLPSSNQIDVWNSLESYVEKFIQGFSYTIFAYGQTGTGKTFTMLGPDIMEACSGCEHACGAADAGRRLGGNISNTVGSGYFWDKNNGHRRRNNSWVPKRSPTWIKRATTKLDAALKGADKVLKSENKGIIPRICEELFRRLDKFLPSEREKIQIYASYVQLYNEKVYDLLTPCNETNAALAIVKDPKNDKAVVVQGLRVVHIKNCRQMLQLLFEGTLNRAYRSTKQNDMSSRSHAIFQVEMRQLIDNRTNSCKLSRLNLVDLAGNEKCKSVGQAVRGYASEMGSINKSLSTLTLCIHQLAKGTNMVSYRNSNLTRLLQDSLGGNCCTLFICTVSPSVLCLTETLSTLRLAVRAKHVKNYERMHEVVNHNTELQNLKQEVSYLRDLLKQTVFNRQPNDKGANSALPVVTDGQIHEKRQIKPTYENRKKMNMVDYAVRSVSAPEMLEEGLSLQNVETNNISRLGASTDIQAILANLPEEEASNEKRDTKQAQVFGLSGERKNSCYNPVYPYAYRGLTVQPRSKPSSCPIRNAVSMEVLKIDENHKEKQGRSTSSKTHFRQERKKDVKEHSSAASRGRTCGNYHNYASYSNIGAFPSEAGEHQSHRKYRFSSLDTQKINVSSKERNSTYRNSSSGALSRLRATGDCSSRGNSRIAERQSSDSSAALGKLETKWVFPPKYTFSSRLRMLKNGGGELAGNPPKNHRYETGKTKGMKKGGSTSSSTRGNYLCPNTIPVREASNKQEENKNYSARLDSARKQGNQLAECGASSSSRNTSLENPESYDTPTMTSQLEGGGSPSQHNLGGTSSKYRQPDRSAPHDKTNKVQLRRATSESQRRVGSRAAEATTKASRDGVPGNSPTKKIYGNIYQWQKSGDEEPILRKKTLGSFLRSQSENARSNNNADGKAVQDPNVYASSKQGAERFGMTSGVGYSKKKGQVGRAATSKQRDLHLNGTNELPPLLKWRHSPTNLQRKTQSMEYLHAYQHHPQHLDRPLERASPTNKKPHLTAQTTSSFDSTRMGRDTKCSSESATLYNPSFSSKGYELTGNPTSSGGSYPFSLSDEERAAVPQNEKGRIGYGGKSINPSTHACFQEYGSLGPQYLQASAGQDARMQDTNWAGRSKDMLRKKLIEGADTYNQKNLAYGIHENFIKGTNNEAFPVYVNLQDNFMTEATFPYYGRASQEEQARAAYRCGSYLKSRGGGQNIGKNFCSILQANNSIGTQAQVNSMGYQLQQPAPENMLLPSSVAAGMVPRENFNTNIQEKDHRGGMLNIEGRVDDIMTRSWRENILKGRTLPNADANQNFNFSKDEQLKVVGGPVRDTYYNFPARIISTQEARNLLLMGKETMSPKGWLTGSGRKPAYYDPASAYKNQLLKQQGELVSMNHMSTRIPTGNDSQLGEANGLTSKHMNGEYGKEKPVERGNTRVECVETVEPLMWHTALTRKNSSKDDCQWAGGQSAITQTSQYKNWRSTEERQGKQIPEIFNGVAEKKNVEQQEKAPGPLQERYTCSSPPAVPIILFDQYDSGMDVLTTENCPKKKQLMSPQTQLQSTKKEYKPKSESCQSPQKARQAEEQLKSKNGRGIVTATNKPSASTDRNKQHHGMTEKLKPAEDNSGYGLDGAYQAVDRTVQETPKLGQAHINSRQQEGYINKSTSIVHNLHPVRYSYMLNANRPPNHQAPFESQQEQYKKDMRHLTSGHISPQIQYNNPNLIMPPMQERELVRHLSVKQDNAYYWGNNSTHMMQIPTVATLANNGKERHFVQQGKQNTEGFHPGCVPSNDGYRHAMARHNSEKAYHSMQFGAEDYVRHKNCSRPQPQELKLPWDTNFIDNPHIYDPYHNRMTVSQQLKDPVYEIYNGRIHAAREVARMDRNIEEVDPRNMAAMQYSKYLNSMRSSMHTTKGTSTTLNSGVQPSLARGHSLLNSLYEASLDDHLKNLSSKRKEELTQRRARSDNNKLLWDGDGGLEKRKAHDAYGCGASGFSRRAQPWACSLNKS